jgi:hypothetical protein
LSSHEQVVGLGEVAFLQDYWSDPSRLCTCGARFAACDFWGGVWRDGPPPVDQVRAVRRIETRLGSTRLFFGLVARGERRLYRAYHAAILRHAREVWANEVTVDSSKVPARMLAQAMLLDADVHIVHLVRDGRSVMDSLVNTGSNRAIEGHIRPPRHMSVRAVLGWTLANACAHVFACRARPATYTRVRYEDFTRDPASVTARILNVCGLDHAGVSAALTRRDALTAGHMVGGNRLRWAADIRVEARPLSPPRLRWCHRVGFGLVGGWLNWLYGYGQS